MSSSIDPAKLKVVDLRNELASRGLEIKGNKAVLVKRLKDALEKELDEDIPDTSIADTTSEELDTSVTEDITEKQAKPEKIEVDTGPQQTPVITKPKEDPKSPRAKEKGSPIKAKPEVVPPKEKTPEKEQEPESPQATPQISEEPQQTTEDVVENVEDKETSEENGNVQAEVITKETEAENVEQGSEDPAEDISQSDETTDHKGEKRKRSSPSPDRSQKKRSRTPVNEDEPEINQENVQLNWYDSDLHLQIDKDTFLSAKPLTDGAFGYAWAGVRATYGISSGKVCYEVKLTEEMKWDDVARIPERPKYDKRNQKKYRDKKDYPPKKEAEEDGKSKDEVEKEKEEPEKMEEGSEPQENPNDIEDKPEEKEPEKPDEKEPEQPDEKEPEKPDEESGKTEDVEMTDNPLDTSDKKEEDTEDKKEEEGDPLPTHLLRVGWSLVSNNLQLGEEKFSYGYESTGKFVTEKMFVDYDKPYKAGDVIGAFLDIDENNVSIRYTLNGEVLPVAVTILKTEFPQNFALFPHVLTRNCIFELNLGQKEEPWFPIPDELKDFVFLNAAESKTSGPSRPETRGDCEVILMCGLPGCGKTHWVKNHVESNQDKRYTVVGNNALLDKMTMFGEPLKSKYKGKWSTFIDRLQKCLNKLISLAALRRRNYIIDQTNVYPSAQRRKMRPFEGFQRKAVVIVLGDEEQVKQQALQEAVDGKEVPDCTILEMKASMSLPEKGDWIEEVIFAGLEEEEAKEQVKKYNVVGKAAGFEGEKRFHRDRWQQRRNDYRGRNYRERGYHHSRYDPRGGRWHSRGGRQGPAGGWRDRRDAPVPWGGNREWRAVGPSGNGRGRDRGGVRENTRNQYQGGGRSRGGSWSSGGGWGQGWNQPAYGNGSYGNWGGYQGSGGGWKYSQGGYGGGYGGGSGGGGGNWNYYGQYPQQSWSNQGQQQAYSSASGGTGSTAGQYNYNTQEAWAQYAKQYAQQNQGAATK